MSSPRPYVAEIAQTAIALVVMMPVAVNMIRGVDVPDFALGLAGIVVGWYFRRSTNGLRSGS